MNRMAWWMVVLLAVMLAGDVVAQPPPKELKVPKGRWLDGERGYLEAKEIQTATGADILLYFRSDEKDEKGLCAWWERHGLQNGKVSKFLDDYIKVKMQLPFRKKELETFGSFKFNKTPAVFVVKSSGWPTKIPVFDWPNNKPQLKDANELIDLITKASTPKEAPAEKTPPAP
jgi:hypothetical protein